MACWKILETPGLKKSTRKSSSFSRGCSTLCLRCVEGGPNAVDARGPWYLWSRLEIPTILSRMRSIRIHKCSYGHSPCSLFQLLFGIHAGISKMLGISIFLDGKILPFPTVATCFKDGWILQNPGIPTIRGFDHLKILHGIKSKFVLCK